MELDDEAKSAARELGDAINTAIGASRKVSEAIEYLRHIGYEPHLNVRLEIALARTEIEADGDFDLELSDEDVRTLRRMKIRFE